jgi:predicted acyl esterase
MIKKTTLLIFSFIFLIPCLKSVAQLSPTVDSIPMSDGKKLAVDIYKPNGISSGPVILIQTPYNRLLYRFGLPLQIGLNLNSSNYIFVITDWRGFYGSAAAAHTGSPSMSEDGYSTVEWIASQSWSNGKVGTWGPSALGRVQFQTAQKNPPHLVCICPLVAAPQYEYVEYFPHGALRTEYVQQLDALGFGLSLLLMAHTVHDNTWTFVENLNDYPDSIRVPCFMIGGWYDHTIEFMLPFFNELRAQSPINVRDKHRLLMGPWVHGGSGIAQVGSATQGELSYPNAAKWNDSLAILFFDYHLRNQSNNWNTTPFVQYYQMGENSWQTSGAWPPAGTAAWITRCHPSQVIP